MYIEYGSGPAEEEIFEERELTPDELYDVEAERLVSEKYPKLEKVFDELESCDDELEALQEKTKQIIEDRNAIQKALTDFRKVIEHAQNTEANDEKTREMLKDIGEYDTDYQQTQTEIENIERRKEQIEEAHAQQLTDFYRELNIRLSPLN